jgi:phosphoglycerate dehydrogenase-like enzyme
MFVTNSSVVVARPEQQHILWCVLSWAKTKQEYKSSMLSGALRQGQKTAGEDISDKELLMPGIKRNNGG